MRTGIATIPLDYGRCPRWLFERMKRLSRAIFLAIREEFGPDEILKRLSDPVWFQSLGCVIGFDYNSSGLTTTTLAAIKAGIFDIQNKLGIYICGGKRTSRKTPEEIRTYADSYGFPFGEKLVYASKITAKVDSSLVQDNYQIYHHNLLFTESGNWAVIQQGLNIENKTARRYHWLSSNIKNSLSGSGYNPSAGSGYNFIEEPHSGIISDLKVKPLNLTAKESKKNREISTELIKEPKTFLKDIKTISEKSNSLIKQKRIKGFCEMVLYDKEFYYHPVLKEKFDLKRLEKTILFANSRNPKNFEQLLSIKGVGPKTIRALSLVSEIIYGAKPSYQDPARYTFAHGGKDHTPYPIDKRTYDSTIEILERGIKKSKIGLSEKEKAISRLKNFMH